MCFDFLYNFCLNPRSIIFNVQMSACKKPVFWRQILRSIKFSRQIFENPQISNFMKILPVGTESLRVDGRTDTDRLTYMAKLIVAFRSFAHSIETLQYAIFPSSQSKSWDGLGNKGIWVQFPPGARYFSVFCCV